MKRKTSLPPASHRLRLNRRRSPGGIFLITKDLDPMRPALAPPLRQWIVDLLKHEVHLGRVELGGFVVMPDHFHVICGLLGDWVLEAWVKRLMTPLGRRTTRLLRRSGCSWQEGFHDREIRNEKEFLDKIDYVHLNPVRKGLVTHPEDWPWSSANFPSWVTLQWR